MNVKKLIEWLSEFPEDYDVVLSETHVLSEDDLIILDMPVVGLTRHDEYKEIRFMIDEPKDEDSTDRHIKSLLSGISGNYVYADASVEFSKEIDSTSMMPLYADIKLRMNSK